MYVLFVKRRMAAIIISVMAVSFEREARIGDTGLPAAKFGELDFHKVGMESYILLIVQVPGSKFIDPKK